MKIFDCFMYFDEEVVLDLRLNILNKYVKKFIITESTFLHSGREKKLNFDIIQKHVDDIVLVSDAAMLDAARWLWFELGIAAELSGAAGIAALSNELISLKAGSNVCSIICGGGTDGISSTI